jgi:hypothetical protein
LESATTTAYKILYAGKVELKAGFYMGIEPVEVIDAPDRLGVEQALIRAVNRGNPVVPTPTRENYPEDPLLKHAKVKSLSIFEKSAQSWKLSKREGAYLIAPYRASNDGGAEEDVDRTEAVPGQEPFGICRASASRTGSRRRSRREEAIKFRFPYGNHSRVSSVARGERSGAAAPLTAPGAWCQCVGNSAVHMLLTRKSARVWPALRR